MLQMDLHSLRGASDMWPAVVVASADLTDRSILRIVDELHDGPVALCLAAYDRVQRSLPKTIEPVTHSLTGDVIEIDSGVTGGSALTGGYGVQLSFGFHAGIVTVRLGGTYPIEDGKAALIAVLPDPDVVRGTLVDLRDSHAFETRSRAELESLGQFLGDLHALLGERVALLVQTDAAYGNGRAIAAWAAADVTPVEVFRSERNALAWLSDAPEFMH